MPLGARAAVNCRPLYHVYIYIYIHGTMVCSLLLYTWYNGLQFTAALAPNGIRPSANTILTTQKVVCWQQNFFRISIRPDICLLEMCLLCRHEELLIPFHGWFIPQWVFPGQLVSHTHLLACILSHSILVGKHPPPSLRSELNCKIWSCPSQVWVYRCTRPKWLVLP